MFEFLQPATLEEAVGLLRDKEQLRVLAGGTDLLIALREKQAPCRYLMDGKKIPELRVLEKNRDGLVVGAAVPLNDLMDSGLLAGEYEVLWQAASLLANQLLRNRATLAGNICNASPGGDMLPACLVLDGFLVTASPRGGRSIPLKDFFTGVKKHVLAPDELVVKTVFPPARGRGFYRKRQRIRGHDLAQVGVAGFHHEDGRLSLAFGAVAPVPVLLDKLGPFQKHELAAQKAALIEKALAGVSPIDDVRSSREYRLDMLRYFTSQILDELAA